VDARYCVTFDWRRKEIVCKKLSSIIAFLANPNQIKMNKSMLNQWVMYYSGSTNYFVYADTYINSIFVEVDKWKFRRGRNID
jgi:hypothetical protein